MSPPRLLAAGRRALARVAAAARRRTRAPSTSRTPSAPRTPSAASPAATGGAAIGVAAPDRRDEPDGAALPPPEPAVPRFDDEHDRAVLSRF